MLRTGSPRRTRRVSNLGPGAGYGTLGGATSFYAPLTNNLNAWGLDSTTPTYSRATTAYVQDHEGVLRLASANEARFWGARRVENILSAGGNGWLMNASFTNGAGGAGAYTTGQPDPFGGNAAYLWTSTAGAGLFGNFARRFVSGTEVLLTVPQTASVYVKGGTGRYIGLRCGSLGSSGSGNNYATLDTQTGAISANGAIGVPQAVSVGNGWWRMWVTGTPTTNLVFDIAVFATVAGDFTIDNGVLNFYLCCPQNEVVAGASVITPSERINPALQFGANVNSVQYFDTVRLHTQNQLLQSENLASATWAKLSCTVGTGITSPIGDASAFAIVEGSGAGISPSVTQTYVNEPFWHTVSFYAKAAGRNFLWVYQTGSITNGSAWYDLANGVIGAVESNTLATITSVGNGWYFCTHRYKTTAGDPGFAGAPVFNSVSGASVTSVTGLNAAGVYLWHPNMSRNTPSFLDTTYVPTTSAAVGPTDTGTTAPIPSTTLLGYMYEPAGTQLVATTAAIRDLTDASWTKTTMTTARTSTGVDGVPSTATRCTATAGNAQALQGALAAAASFRYLSVYLRRVTGTGNINITQDGGTTWTPVMSGAGTGQWVKMQTVANVLNPQIGIQIVTNGDAVDVDFVQLEAAGTLPHATSPMATTGASRNPDFLSFPAANNVSGVSGSAYLEVGCTALQNTVGAPSIGGLDLGTNELLEGTNVGQAFSNDGTSIVVTTGGTQWLAGEPKKMAIAYGSLTRSMAITGGTLLSGAAFDNDFTANSIRIGTNGSVSAAPSGAVRNVRIYAQKLSDAQLTAMVA